MHVCSRWGVSSCEGGSFPLPLEFVPEMRCHWSGVVELTMVLWLKMFFIFEMAGQGVYLGNGGSGREGGGPGQGGS